MNEDDLWITNRVRKTEPLKDRASWCDWCDRDKVRPGEKCSICGHRLKTKHRKPKRNL
jgi:rRNA maturation endonuclease Nob1